MRKATAIIFAMLFLVLVGGCSDKGQEAISKDEILKLVENKKHELNKAADEISSIDEYITMIGIAEKFDDIDELDDIKGLFNSGIMSGRQFYSSMNNDNLENLLKDGQIRYITVYPNSICHTSEFPCGVKNSEYDTGFYYSEANIPLYRGAAVDFIDDDGGFSYSLANGNVFYTEKITDNWYYYLYTYSSQGDI